MTGRFERREPVRVSGVAIGVDRDERAVGAVFVWTSSGFIDDRQRALPALAGALGDQLLDPQTERRQRRRQDDRQLVAAARGRGADKGAELQPGIGQVLLAAPVGHRFARGEQTAGRSADEGRWNKAEQRQCRETAADVGRVDEDLAIPRGGAQRA